MLKSDIKGNDIYQYLFIKISMYCMHMNAFLIWYLNECMKHNEVKEITKDR